MQAAVIDKPGPADSIEIRDIPDPIAKDGEVLVRVKAVAVNPIDTYIRAGIIAMDLPSPYIVGCDLAGTVESVGPDVTRFQPGDRVWGSNQGLFGRQGSFAEFAVVDQEFLYPIPDGVSETDMAALALVGITAHLGLFLRAKLHSGESLFVNGGSGGVGSTVVQMAKASGAKVMTTAGSEDKVQLCKDLGADCVVNYKTDDVDAAIKSFAPKGVDIWWETLRTPDFERTVSHLAPRGRMVLMAGREARPTFPVGPFYVKDCSVVGFAMFNASADEQRRCSEDINTWVTSGKLKPRIDRVLPLAETAQAHAIQEESTVGQTGTLAGKIVLEV